MSDQIVVMNHGRVEQSGTLSNLNLTLGTAGAPSNAYATEDRQRVALLLLRHGAALVGLCADRVYPSPRGLEFGSGSQSAMLSYAANVEPFFCGKPEKIFFMELCQNAKAFLHCSSTAVYQPNGDHPRFKETDPLGDNHRPMQAFVPDMQTYSITKIGAEGVARWGARRFDVPTTITRLNVPYGDKEFSWPGSHLDSMVAGQPVAVHTDGHTEYNPIHDDDILGMLPGMLEIASVPVTTVNWGGHDAVSIEEWCAYFGELTGIEPQFFPTDMTLQSVSVDVTKMEQLVGKPSVGWKDGWRRIVRAHYPDLLKSDA
jgi:hypothetical protein